MIPAEDLRPGLFVAIRFAREYPHDDVWDHVATPAVYRVLGLALPYVSLECLATGRRFPADVSVFQFEQLRPEFVATIFPDKANPQPKAAASAAPSQDRDERGYPRPVRLLTILSPGNRGLNDR